MTGLFPKAKHKGLHFKLLVFNNPSDGYINLIVFVSNHVPQCFNTVIEFFRVLLLSEEIKKKKTKKPPKKPEEPFSLLKREHNGFRISIKKEGRN